MSDSQLSFSYRPRWSLLILGVLFGGVGGVGMAAFAASNPHGLIIDGIISLSPANANIFYSIIAWAFLSYAGFALFMMVVRIVNPQTLELTEEGLWAPRWAWSRQRRLIPYSEIRELRMKAYKRHQWMKIIHMRGSQNIVPGMMESQWVFDEFCSQFARRVGKSRALAVESAMLGAVNSSPLLENSNQAEYGTQGAVKHWLAR